MAPLGFYHIIKAITAFAATPQTFSTATRASSKKGKPWSPGSNGASDLQEQHPAPVVFVQTMNAANQQEHRTAVLGNQSRAKRPAGGRAHQRDQNEDKDVGLPAALHNQPSTRSSGPYGQLETMAWLIAAISLSLSSGLPSSTGAARVPPMQFLAVRCTTCLWQWY